MERSNLVSQRKLYISLSVFLYLEKNCMSQTHDVYLFPSPLKPRDVILRPIPTIPILNLIEKSLQYAKDARIEFLTANWGIVEPLTPKARRNHLYLMIREFIMKGCREATKHVLDHYKRSIVYGVLVQATEAVFYYGYRPEIISYYNDLLDRLIGTH